MNLVNKKQPDLNRHTSRSFLAMLFFRAVTNKALFSLSARKQEQPITWSISRLWTEEAEASKPRKAHHEGYCLRRFDVGSFQILKPCSFATLLFIAQHPKKAFTLFVLFSHTIFSFCSKAGTKCRLPKQKFFQLVSQMICHLNKAQLILRDVLYFSQATSVTCFQ